MSYLINHKRGRNGENEKSRMYLVKECFFHFYGYQDLSEKVEYRKIHVLLPNRH
jgi:hypothetical protein